MFPYILVLVLTCLEAVSSRDSGRPMPTITNSLVNLGKMEISLYLNGQTPDSSKVERGAQPSSSIVYPKYESFVQDPCPCSNFNEVKETFFKNPSEILNKILTSNNLFSHHNEPRSLCCESNEHQDTIFEFGNQKHKQPPINSYPTFLFDSVIPKNFLHSSMPTKPKMVEIFLFPKKGGATVNLLKPGQQKKKEFIGKEGIQAVGDKEIRNEFKKPIFTVSSIVKKDLAVAEKDTNAAFKKEDNEIIATTTLKA